MNYYLSSIISIAIALSFTACINDNSTGPLSEGEALAGSEVNVAGSAGEDSAGEDSAGEGSAGEGSAGEGSAGEGSAGEGSAGEGSAGEGSAGEGSAGEGSAGEGSAGEDLIDPPPPPPNASPCDRFCQRVEDCLYPRCEPLSEIPVEQFCRGWCRGTGDDWLDGGANLSCEDFTRRIYGFSPELGTLCDADPEVDSCEVICDFGQVCGLVSNECLSNCSESTNEAQLCFLSASNAQDCRRFAQCYEQPSGPRDEESGYEQVCANLCEREANCVFNACAPGTIDAATVTDCVDLCVDDQASSEALTTRYQRTCEEVVSDTLTNDSALSERCDTPEDQVCSTLCTDTVTGCGEIDLESCEQRCASWDEANYYCLRRAGNCDEVSDCLIDQSEQDRCRRSCDHLQSCLEEACPPRIIPPGLTDSCTADCFDDPISEEDLSDWEMTACREVREVVYQDNQQLRPICEGNQDFRPSPAECSDFCDSGLDLCVIGNRTICLSACAGLTREQYLCALEADSDCMAIESCLSE